mmetsp:Transcript_37169/g.80035  ORF Transcript_37169/g.80035 Transcript_37169/m.80035 type:complete len:455 (+) Transcript_37169:790-2154(+)
MGSSKPKLCRGNGRYLDLLRDGRGRSSRVSHCRRGRASVWSSPSSHWSRGRASELTAAFPPSCRRQRRGRGRYAASHHRTGVGAATARSEPTGSFEQSYDEDPSALQYQQPQRCPEAPRYQPTAAACRGASASSSFRRNSSRPSELCSGSARPSASRDGEGGRGNSDCRAGDRSDGRHCRPYVSDSFGSAATECITAEEVGGSPSCRSHCGVAQRQQRPGQRKRRWLRSQGLLGPGGLHQGVARPVLDCPDGQAQCTDRVGSACCPRGRQPDEKVYGKENAPERPQDAGLCCNPLCRRVGRCICLSKHRTDGGPGEDSYLSGTGVNRCWQITTGVALDRPSRTGLADPGQPSTAPRTTTVQPVGRTQLGDGQFSLSKRAGLFGHSKTVLDQAGPSRKSRPRRRAEAQEQSQAEEGSWQRKTSRSCPGSRSRELTVEPGGVGWKAHISGLADADG